MIAARSLGMALLLASSVRAQTVLQLPASTRALGVGDAFVAGRGSDMIFYNPAMLALQPGLSASMQRYGDASTLGALSSTFSSGPLAAGAGAQLLDYGAETASGTRAGNLGERGDVSAASLAASLALASQVKGVRIGVAAKYITTIPCVGYKLIPPGGEMRR